MVVVVVIVTMVVIVVMMVVVAVIVVAIGAADMVGMVVVEEVRVKKTATERDQKVRDTVRHTDVKVDRDADRGRTAAPARSGGLGYSGPERRLSRQRYDGPDRRASLR